MGTTERLVVDLPSELVAGLRKSIRSGAFASESEALEVLLRTWFGMDEPDIETLRAFVAEGVADAEAGRVSDGDDVFTRVLGRIDALEANRIK